MPLSTIILKAGLNKNDEQLVLDRQKIGTDLDAITTQDKGNNTSQYAKIKESALALKEWSHHYALSKSDRARFKLHIAAEIQTIYSALKFNEDGSIANSPAELIALKAKVQQIHATFRLYKILPSTIFARAMNPLATALGMSAQDISEKTAPYPLLVPFEYVINKIIDHNKRAVAYVDHFKTLLQIKPDSPQAQSQLDEWKQTPLAQGWITHKEYAHAVQKITLPMLQNTEACRHMQTTLTALSAEQPQLSNNNAASSNTSSMSMLIDWMRNNNSSSAERATLLSQQSSSSIQRYS